MRKSLLAVKVTDSGCQSVSGKGVRHKKLEKSQWTRMQACGRSASEQVMRAWRHILFTFFRSPWFEFWQFLSYLQLENQNKTRFRLRKVSQGLLCFCCVHVCCVCLCVCESVFCLKSSGLSFNITFQVFANFCLFCFTLLGVSAGYKTMYTYFYTRSRSHSGLL